MKLTAAEREEIRKMGRKGGKARAASMTKEERRKLAQKAVRARWAKFRQKEKANGEKGKAER
jgi:hypothetical protein